MSVFWSERFVEILFGVILKHFYFFKYLNYLKDISMQFFKIIIPYHIQAIKPSRIDPKKKQSLRSRLEAN